VCRGGERAKRQGNHVTEETGNHHWGEHKVAVNMMTREKVKKKKKKNEGERRRERGTIGGSLRLRRHHHCPQEGGPSLTRKK